MTPIIVWSDTETRSEVDLKATGAAKYAEHPSTRIQLFSYAFDDGDVNLWSPEDGEPMPDDLRQAFESENYIFHFHNRFFDAQVIEHTLGIYLPIQRYRCVMAAALSHALPGALDKLGEVLGLPQDQRKHKEGKRLVQLFCKPKKLKDGTLKWATPQTHPAEWALYKEYCKQDTATMRLIAKRIPRWNYPYNPTELELWYADQECNSRGMAIDLELARAAMDFIAREQALLSSRTKEMTEGEVQAASQRDAMLRYIARQYNIDLADMRKSTLEKIVDDEEYPLALRELLRVRLDTCTTSTAKYKKIVAVTSSDGRVRGTIQFAGASRTLRDGGRLVQPQNYARPTLKHDTIIAGIAALIGGFAKELGYDIMELTSSALRYTIIAKPGCKLCVSDLANIEGRGLAYLAGEEWKIQAFREFDAGRGPDMYKAAYAKAFGVDFAEVNKDQRTIGKLIELSMGYGGSAAAFMNFALIYGQDLDLLARQILPTLPEEIRKEAESFYDWLNEKDISKAKNEAVKADMTVDDWRDFYDAKSTVYLPRQQYVAFDALKRLWRQSHPKTVAFWKDAETAVRKAIVEPNKDFHFANGLIARKSGVWVRIVLPSGRCLCYPQMQVDENDRLRFKGIGQFTKKWEWTPTRSSRLVENCVQAFARDIFKYGQVNAMREGYNVVLPVHDELVCEVPDTPEYSVKRLEEIMSTNPPWARDIPLAAEGFEDYRYHK